MNSPLAALTWEIWCRHRKRLLTVLFVILGFALFYSKLCASIGFDLDSANALDFLTQKAPALHGPRSEIFQVLACLFLLCAPLACMVITMLYVVWVFTFTDLNPREPFSFPKRLFTLPISTRFLAARLISSGTVAVFLVYLGWTRLVHLPHIEVFDRFNDGLAWIALLILSQGIVWSLDAFPFTRVLLLSVVTFCLLGHPDFQWIHSLEAHQTAVQLLLILMGSVLACVGLDKIRHGVHFDFHPHRLGGLEDVFQGAIAAPAAADQPDLEFPAGVLRANIEQRQGRNHCARYGDVFDEFATGHVEGVGHKYIVQV